MSKPLRFGLRTVENKEMLDRYAPDLIASAVRAVLKRARPDWATFELRIEPSYAGGDYFDIRVDTLGEKR